MFNPFKKKGKKSEKEENGENSKKDLLKKLYLLSIGTLIGGSSFYFVRKKAKDEKKEKPIKIDESKSWIFIETNTFKIPIEGEERECFSRYDLEKTSFFIVSLFTDKGSILPVYYVIPHRIVKVGDGMIESTGDPFYAVIGVPGKKGMRDKLGYLQKGERVVFHLCIVGGSKNGVPTGDKLYSRGTVKEISFE